MNKIKYKKIYLLIIAEILFIVGYLLFLVFCRDSLNKTIYGFSSADMVSDVTVPDNGSWVFTPESCEKNGTKKPILYGSGKSLKKGTYTFDVWYHADSNQTCNVYIADSYGAEVIAGGKYILEKNRNHETLHFETLTAVNSAKLRFYYNGKGTFIIKDIKLSANDAYFRRGLVLLLFFIILLDLFLIIRKLEKEKQKEYGMIILIGMLSSLPLFYRGLNGHDLSFHLMRIEGLAEELRLGHLMARLQSLWVGGYGYPVSIYYGDILLYFPALLRLLGFSINTAFKSFVFVVNLLTSVSCLYCFRSIFKDSRSGFLLTLAFLLSPYRLMDIYVRSAVGEYSVMLFFPLIALAVYRMYCGEENRTIRYYAENIVLFAIGMTGIVTSHVLSAEMVTVVLGIIILLTIKKSLKKEIVITFVSAAVLSLLLSFYFIIPFIDYTLSVNVSVRNSSPRIQRLGANIADYFAVFKNPFGWAPNMLYTPGIVLLLVFFAAVWLWHKRIAGSKLKLLTVISAILFWLSSNIFPWDTLAYQFRIFRPLVYVQFPWRYVGLLSFILTLLLGEILSITEKAENPAIKSGNELIFKYGYGLVIMGLLVFLSYYGDNADRTVFYDTNNLDSCVCLGGGEYLRAIKTENGKTLTDPERYDGMIHGDFDTLEVIDRKGSDITFTAKTDKETEVVLPLINYKGYRVSDSNGKQYEIHDSDNLLVAFDLPPQFEGTIHVEYIVPWYWNAAVVISLITVIICLIILFCKLRPAERMRI